MAQTGTTSWLLPEVAWTPPPVRTLLCHPVSHGSGIP